MDDGASCVCAMHKLHMLSIFSHLQPYTQKSTVSGFSAKVLYDVIVTLVQLLAFCEKRNACLSQEVIPCVMIFKVTMGSNMLNRFSLISTTGSTSSFLGILTHVVESVSGIFSQYIDVSQKLKQPSKISKNIFIPISKSFVLHY